MILELSKKDLKKINSILEQYSDIIDEDDEDGLDFIDRYEDVLKPYFKSVLASKDKKEVYQSSHAQVLSRMKDLEATFYEFYSSVHRRMDTHADILKAHAEHFSSLVPRETFLTKAK